MLGSFFSAAPAGPPLPPSRSVQPTSNERCRDIMARFLLCLLSARRRHLLSGALGSGRLGHGCSNGSLPPRHSPLASCFSSAYFFANSSTASSLLSTCNSSQ